MSDAANPVLNTIMNRTSVRRWEDRDVPDDVLETMVLAGRQAPFTGQSYSVVVTRDKAKREELSKIFGRMCLAAPVFMLICCDFRKLEKFITAKGRQNRMEDMGLLMFSVQDAAYFGENMVLAAESLGLGTVFLGSAPFVADRLAPMFNLPPRVFPLVGLLVGYRAENPSPRPRVPLKYVMHWDEYHDLTGGDVQETLSVMDAGLIREGYYQKLNAKIALTDGSEDKVSLEEYGWGEHVSRKYSQWRRVVSHNLAKQGINVE